MLSIGDFARRGGVTVKTLRYYDDIGLLPPAHVDPATGYRFYIEGQLPRLQRIAELKALGFRLEDLGPLLATPPPPEEWQRQLEANQARLLRQIHAGQAALARVDSALRTLLVPGGAHLSTVELIELEPMLVAGIRDRIPEGTVFRLFEELQAWLSAQGSVAYGPFLTLGYHDGPHIRGEQDIEAAVYLATPLTGSERVRVYELPATPAIRVMHTGDYRQLARAYEELHIWRHRNGYDSPIPWREIYWRDGRHVSDPTEFVTELIHPVQPWAGPEDERYPRLLHVTEMPGLRIDYYESAPPPPGLELRPGALPPELSVRTLDERSWIAVDTDGQIVLLWAWVPQRRPHLLSEWAGGAEAPPPPEQIAEAAWPTYLVPGIQGWTMSAIVVGTDGYVVVSGRQSSRELLLGVAGSLPLK